jgi:hypothetical protein
MLQAEQPERYFLENCMDRPTKWKLTNTGKIIEDTEAQNPDWINSTFDEELEYEEEVVTSTPIKRQAPDHTDSPAPKLLKISTQDEIMEGDQYRRHNILEYLVTPTTMTQ